MPRPGVAAPRGGISGVRSTRNELDFLFDSWEERFGSGPDGGVPGRRTVTITGQGAEGVETRNGTRPSSAQRLTRVKPYERAGFRPDRMAMWAVFLGIVMLLVAAVSAHAAVVVAHHALALR